MVAGIDGYTSSMLSCPLTSEFGGSIWETTLAAEQHDAFGALAGAGTPLSIDARWLVQAPEPGGAAGAGAVAAGVQRQRAKEQARERDRRRRAKAKAAQAELHSPCYLFLTRSTAPPSPHRSPTTPQPQHTDSDTRCTSGARAGARQGAR